MDLLTALKILIRQWPVVLAGLVLTVIGVRQVGPMVEPTYEAKGTVLLLSPGADANPYLDFGPNLEVAADALMVVVQSPAGTARLEAAGGAGGFELERVSGPLIDISASAPSEDEATRTVALVVAALQAELETKQASAPADQHITLDELTQPVAEAKLGSRIRAQAAVGALGLVCTVAAGLTVDAVRRHRRERRARRLAAAGTDAPTSTDAGPRARAGGEVQVGARAEAEHDGSLHPLFAPAMPMPMPANGRSARPSVYPAPRHGRTAPPATGPAGEALRPPEPRYVRTRPGGADPASGADGSGPGTGAVRGTGTATGR